MHKEPFPPPPPQIPLPGWRSACLDALDVMRDDPGAGRKMGEALMADARARGDAAAVAGAELVLAFADHYSHRIDAGGAVFERLAPQLEAAGDRLSLVLCLFGQVVTWRLQGRLAEAYALAHMRLLALLDGEATRENILGYNVAAIVALETGHTEEALGHFHTALDLARRACLPARIAHVSANLAELFYVSCNAADAETMLLSALEAAREAGERWVLPFVSTLLALTRLALEKYDEAWDMISGYLASDAAEAPDAAPDGIDMLHRIFFLSVAAYAQAKRGALAEADELDQRAHALLARCADKRLQSYTWWVSGILHHLHGRLDAAIADLQHAIDTIGDRGYLYMPINALQALVQIHEARADWEAAFRAQQRLHDLSMRAQAQAAIVRVENLRISEAVKAAGMARMHAEESLAERNIILDNAMVAIIFLNPEGRVQWANQAMYQMFGVPPGDHAGMSLKRFYASEEDYYSVGAAVVEAMRAGRSFEDERLMRRLDGSLFWAYTSGRAVNWRDSSKGTVWAVMDISKRRALEGELKHSQENYRKVVDNAAEGIMVIQDGIVVFANERVRELSGYPPEKMIGQPFVHNMHPDDVAHMVALHTARMAGDDERRTNAFRVIHYETGAVLWAEAITVTIDWEGRPATLAFMTDITGRKQLEDSLKHSLAELSKSEEHYRQVISNATECILVVQEGHIVFANPRVFELTGYGDELYDVPFTEAIYYEDQPLVIDHHVRRLRGEKVDQYYQFRLQPKNRPGETVWVELSAVMIEWEGRPATLSFMTDITERMRLQSLQIENELREAEVARKLAEETTRAKSMFLANMSHEIRTPMNAIIGMAHLALRTELNNKQRDYVEKIHGAGVSLLGILNDILDFSKVEAGKIDLEHVEFNLERVLDNVAAVTSGNAHEKDLEYLLQLAPEVPRNLMGDPLRLGQVLINLVNNGIKFTEHGEICIACIQRVGEAKGGTRSVELEFAVRDTGIGMTAEQSAQLFQPFMQADGSTTRKYGGTGLGLSICKGMVELMGGRIWLDTTPGAGTTVRFTARFELAPMQPQRVVVPAALNGIRILAVDDNEVARMILAENLSALPVAVETAASGEEALAMVRDADAAGLPFGVVFSDVRMPGMDGFALTRQVKQPGALATPPKMVLVSAYDRDEVGNVGAVGRADAFLSKPVNASALFDTMLDLLAPDGRVARVAANVAIPAFRDLRVLLVEDNEINQQIAAELMDAAGVETDVARNGRVALEMLAAVPVDHYGAILMDVQMPEMDGHEATRRIRADERYADLPIIAMTAHAMVEERARCAASGMDDHIAKPINPAELFDTLSRWCPLNAYQSVQDESYTVDAPDLVIEGVDVTEGLTRTLGNRAFYFDMLSRYREGQRYAVAEMRACLHDGDFDQAERIAHTLKGVAGQLGARGIQALAAQAEQLMHQEAEEATWGPLLAQLEADMIALDSALARALPQAQEAEAAPAPAALDDNLLARLSALLADSDAEAADLLAELSEPLQTRLGTEAFQRLARAVRQYDYDSALAVLASATQ